VPGYTARGKYLKAAGVEPHPKTEKLLVGGVLGFVSARQGPGLISRLESSACKNQAPAADWLELAKFKNTGTRTAPEIAHGPCIGGARPRQINRLQGPRNLISPGGLGLMPNIQLRCRCSAAANPESRPQWTTGASRPRRSTTSWKLDQSCQATPCQRHHRANRLWDISVWPLLQAAVAPALKRKSFREAGSLPQHSRP